MKQLFACPICGSAESGTFLICEDHTVSKEVFTIVSCKGCGFKYTNPRPDNSSLGEYYKSENYISHSNTNKGLINNIYQLVRGITLKRKLRLINSIHTSGNLLDIGCGTGDFLATCKKAGWSVTGIEPSDIARKSAENRFSIIPKEENELDLLPERSYDIITLWHVLEHVSDLDERLLQIARLLKPEGTVLVAVPNCSSWDCKYYGALWAAYDVPRHLSHFTPQDIDRLFSKYSMKVVSILPMKYDSFYVSMLSEKIKTTEGNILRAFFNGLLSNFKATNKTYSSQIYIIKKG
jgi:2-polyprenyl-3-methyl-5-hydroxy-6-metoxy-1,4-benzoquinol methylase